MVELFANSGDPDQIPHNAINLMTQTVDKCEPP